MAVPERLAGSKNGWRFIIFAGFCIVGGALLIAAGETLGAARLLAPELRDTALVLGGVLMGLVAVGVDELYRVAPERRRAQMEREAELARHQDERRLDFEQYRTLQTELRQQRSRAEALESKLELGGALDRDRVGDALLLGFYFHRRSEGLPSSPKHSIFKTAARRLKVLSETATDVHLDKGALRAVLEIAYGPVVAESFDLGYVLSHLGEDGLAEPQHPDIVAELEKQLKALNLNSKPAHAADISDDVSGLFKKLAARVSSIVRRS